MTHPAGGTGPARRPRARAVKLARTDRLDGWSAGRLSIPRKGCARLRTARGEPDRKGLSKGASQAPWRLPALHSLRGKEKGDRPSRGRSKNTGDDACVRDLILRSRAPRGVSKDCGKLWPHGSRRAPFAALLTMRA